MKQTSRLKHVALGVLTLCIMLGPISAQQGYAQEKSGGCTLATLNGSYVFDATGYNIVNGSPVPKAVVEFLNFNGDGTLTSLSTVSLNGNIVQHFAAGTGSYTVNQDCTGSLTFSPAGLTFDLFITHNGSEFHMIETVPGTVLAGRVRRVQDLEHKAQQAGTVIPAEATRLVNLANATVARLQEGQ